MEQQLRRLVGIEVLEALVDRGASIGLVAEADVQVGDHVQQHHPVGVRWRRDVDGEQVAERRQCGLELHARRLRGRQLPVQPPEVRREPVAGVRPGDQLLALGEDVVRSQDSQLADAALLSRDVDPPQPWHRRIPPPEHRLRIGAGR
jgi:hypothetical protein